MDQHNHHLFESFFAGPFFGGFRVCVGFVTLAVAAFAYSGTGAGTDSAPGIIRSNSDASMRNSSSDFGFEFIGKCPFDDLLSGNVSVPLLLIDARTPWLTDHSSVHMILLANDTIQVGFHVRSRSSPAADR
jgi:hypothetical protein